MNRCGTEIEKPSEVQPCEVVEEGGEEPELPTGLFLLNPEELAGATLLGIITASLVIYFFLRNRGGRKGRKGTVSLLFLVLFLSIYGYFLLG